MLRMRCVGLIVVRILGTIPEIPIFISAVNNGHLKGVAFEAMTLSTVPGE
jgi:hypothetical protein